MKECYSCSHYKAYYTRGYIKFNRADKGWCRQNGCTKKNHESCETWKQRRQQQAPKAVLVNVLREMQQSLKVIEQVLCGEQEEQSQETETLKETL